MRSSADFGYRQCVLAQPPFCPGLQEGIVHAEVIVRTGGCPWSAVPQLEQNAAPSGFSAPRRLQNMPCAFRWLLPVVVSTQWGSLPGPAAHELQHAICPARSQISGHTGEVPRSRDAVPAP